MEIIIRYGCNEMEFGHFLNERVYRMLPGYQSFLRLITTRVMSSFWGVFWVWAVTA